MNISYRSKKLTRFSRRSILATAIALSMTQGAYALSFSPSEDIQVDLDTTIKYNAQWRAVDPSTTNLGGGGDPVLGILADDGNRNFDKGDMTQNQVSFTTDLDIHRQNTGVFMRARGWYDEVYDHFTPVKSFQQDGIDYHAAEIELLDAFVYHTADTAAGTLDLRIGRQVVNWGESMFITGGISSAQVPLDAIKANAPGVELKEVFLPVGQVYASMDLNETLSVSGYYQYEWEKTVIDAPGSFFSVLDAWGKGAVGDMTDIGAPVAEDHPDGGQWGVAVRYLAEELNNTEFGLYYLNYTDTLPSITLAPPLTPFEGRLRYFEDIDLIGASFGTVVGDTNISGEISYRNGQPLQITGGGAFYYVPGETVQAQASMIHIFGATPFADNLVLMGEYAYNRALSIDADANASLILASQGIDAGDLDNALDNGKGGSSMVLSLKADYFNVLPATDMTVTATYRQDFGTAPTAFLFYKDRKDLALKLDFIKGSHGFGASYVNYLTDLNNVAADQGLVELGHMFADRDYFSLYYKYSF